MSDEPKKNDWFSPQMILAVLGMLSAVAGAWMSFDSRISTVESDSRAANSRFERIERTSDRIENKLDRLLLDRGDDR